MSLRYVRPSRPQCIGALLGLSLVVGVALLARPAPGQQAGAALLRIGSSGTLVASGSSKKEEAALETLHRFIKDETSMSNEIVPQKNWRDLAAKMAKGELQLGVFQGYEFAWAQEQYPKLKPLALAVNVHRYPVVYVVTRRDDPVKGFAGLQGHTLTLPASAPPNVRLYLERECQANGKGLEAFLAKVTPAESAEDALDDVVDGKVTAAAADRAALEAYRRSKPGRFRQLQEVAKSPPFPPAVVANEEGSLDAATLQRFQHGLLDANKKERGEMILTLFRLTGFEPVPPDFDRVLVETRKHFPAPTKS